MSVDFNLHAFSHCRGKQGLLHTKEVWLLLTKFLKTEKGCCCNQFFTFREKKVGPGQIHVHMKKHTAITITGPPPVSPWAEESPGWIGWSSSRHRCQSKTFIKVEIFSRFFLHNLLQCPFFPPADFCYLWWTQFYKSKKIATVQNALQYCCCMFPSQSNTEHRKNRTICPKTSCDRT